MIRALPVLLALLAVPVPSARAEEALVVEETILPVTIGDQRYRLQALVAKEAGQAGRLPVALITHGQAAEPEKREQVQARSYLRIAREFARRGWLAVVVVRRGFGRSEGDRPFALRGCANGDYGVALDEQTDDLDAALQALGRRGDADVSQAIALGVSVGGAAVLNWAARQPAGLKAVVNVSGGIRSLGRNGAAPGCSPDDLVPVFGRMGERSRIPSLWLYAENDSFFPADYVRGLHEAYVAKGGRTDFHMFDPVGSDGHDLLGHADGLLRWLPALDRFLRANRLRTYDPAPLETALRELNLGPAMRQWAARYGGRPTEKAMAISASNARGSVQFGRTDLQEAEQKAVEECEKIAKETCRVVLRNFEVAPPPAH
jgi:dienelactone hydrolase